LLTPGPQHLTGAQAVAFATFLAPQEAEQARLARFSAVLAAVLAKLPPTGAGQTAMLAHLGATSKTTLPLSRLVSFLGDLRADTAGQRMSFDTVPTRELDPGGNAVPTLVLDPNSARQLVTANFADSELAQRPGGPVRVLVQNGVGTPGLGARAGARLVAAGLTYIEGGNAPAFGYRRSYILILDASAASQNKGRAVAKALGLPYSDIAVTSQGQNIADVVVVLGADFKP
jgi:hypothetical protein